GIEIGPHRLGAIPLRRLGQAFGDLVERVVPRNPDKGVAAPPLLADPAQRRHEALGVMLALGIMRDLGAYHALRVGLPLGPAHPANAHSADALDRERTGARTVMRA